jgi:hypothetical protein
MVRIFKVKELEEQKRELLARSEMYRQTLKLEVANIKFSASLLKHRYSRFRNASRLMALMVPIAGLFLFRRPAPPQEKTNKGILGGLASGLKLFGMLRPILHAFHSTERQGSKQGNGARFS